MLLAFPTPLAEQKANMVNGPTGKSPGWERESLSLRRDCSYQSCLQAPGRRAPLALHQCPPSLTLSRALCSLPPAASGWVSELAPEPSSREEARRGAAGSSLSFPVY